MVPKKYFLPLFLLVQIVAVKILALFPEIIERYYSNGMYTIISKFFRNLLGGLSFSFGDVLYGFLFFLLLKWFLKNRVGFVKEWKSNALRFLSVLSVMYFLFHVLWGLNYYRTPFQEKFKISNSYSHSELDRFTKKMIAKSNQLQLKITFNDTVAVKIPYTDKELFYMAENGFHKLPKKLKEVDYQSVSIKKSLFSVPLSYMGFGGYLNPFTNETQINYLKPKYVCPFTICHEMAHQVGIASESECNFIGFLAATHHTDDYFKYAAYTTAVRYCLRNLEDMKKGLSKPYLKLLHAGVLKNFEEDKKFWATYQTPLQSCFEYIYDNFLKANQQNDGLEGYNKFIGLLINYEKK